MADPLRHGCKLDVAEEILDFIANNPDAGKVREEIINLIDLTEEDIEDAAEVVTDINRLMKNQGY
jgi:hypothetical protein